jgi:phosphomethylpyrimidine synthase
MSIRQDAINRVKTPLFEACALNESISLEQLMDGVAKGELVITKNNNHNFEKIIAIGKNVSTKINANIGSSKDLPELQSELQKLCVAIKAGADTVMDLSMGGDLDAVRRGILEQCPVPLGTVPIYQAVAETVEQQKKAIVDVEVDHIFKTIAKQAEDGVDFMTIHCGITKNTLERMNSQERLMGVVSRGGSFTIEWMSYHNKENPLYENFDDLLAVLKEHEVTLSLGDGIRPGCLVDATDRNQVQELIHLGELTDRAWDAGVQVIIEGPGHMPMNQIEADHITGAIGGAIAGAAGADYLCYVTPAEHLKLPSIDDVKEGVIASKIAAHAADIAKGLPGAIDKDIAMARCRNNLDWKGQIDLSIDPEKARRFRDEGGTYKGDACSMCGSYCAIKVFKRARKKSAQRNLNNN